MARNPVIDNLKGLGISLVILGHLPISKELFKVIYSVHMPLFFFVSGFLFKTDKNFKNFFRKKYVGIVKPFLTFAFLTYLLHRFFSLITNNKNFSTINEFFVSLLYGNAFDDHLSWNPPLWFLPCLVTLLILFYFVEKFQNRIIFLSILLIFFIGIFLSYQEILLPWGITTSFMAIPFVGFGFLIKRTGWLDKLLTLKTIFWIIPLLLFGVCIVYNYGFLNFAVNKFGNIFLSYSGAFLGILLLLKVSSFINSRQLEFIGKNSLFIFAFHIFLNAIVKRGSGLIENKLPVDLLALSMLFIVIVIFFITLKLLMRNEKLKKLLFIN